MAITRTTAGLVAEYFQSSTLDPGWTYYKTQEGADGGSQSFSLVAADDLLKVEQTANDPGGSANFVEGIMLNDGYESDTHFLCYEAKPGDAGRWIGVCAPFAPPDGSSAFGYGYIHRTRTSAAHLQILERGSSNVLLDSDTFSGNPSPTAYRHNQFFVAPGVQAGWNSYDGGTVSATDTAHNTLVAGVGVFYLSFTAGDEGAIKGFLHFKDRTITVTGLDTGYKAQVRRSNDDALVAEATESSGVATVDCSIEGGANHRPFYAFEGFEWYLEVRDGSNTLVETYDATHVRPGDEYAAGLATSNTGTLNATLPALVVEMEGTVTVAPGAPTITGPLDAATLTGESVTVSFTAATDPLGYSLYYTLQSSPAGAGMWTDLFTERESTADFEWDISAYADGNYDLRLFATRASGPELSGAADEITVTIDNTLTEGAVLVNPVDGETYQDSTVVSYLPPPDPVGTVTYTLRWSPASAGTWTNVFADRVGDDPYLWDLSGFSDADYDLEFWADTPAGQGPVTELTITIDNGTPGPPNITEPFAGEDVLQGTLEVEWEAATDPNDDPLTYDLEYRAVGAGSWTSITTGVGALTYSWNMSALTVGDYELAVRADDGTNLGPRDIEPFSVITANQPGRPALRVVAVDASCVTVELRQYVHPNSVAWESTTYLIYPVGGDVTNPVLSYTTTDPDEQLGARLCGLPPGFTGYVVAYFTDANSNDGDTSGPAEFTVLEVSRKWEQRWATDANWWVGGLGDVTGICEQISGDGLNPQEDAALVDGEAQEVGSVFVSGEVMFGGCNCGWIGRDTELRVLGVGYFEGYEDDDSWQGIYAAIDTGTSYSFGLGATTLGRLIVRSRFPNGREFTASADLNGLMARTVASITNYNGAPIGNWSTGDNREPWYRIELRVNRTVGASPSTRIRAKIYAAAPAIDGDPLKTVPVGEWHIDRTYPYLGPCGRPGYVLARPGLSAPPSAQNFYKNLRYQALRDEGLPTATTTPYPAFDDLEDPLECLTVAVEDELPTPIFFPVPPDGEVTEDVEYPTDVIGTWDETEQRLSLRDSPVRGIAFAISLLSVEENTDFLQLLLNDQPSRWIIPMWMDAGYLLEDFAGGTTIQATAFEREGSRLEEASHVALYRDQFDWEVSEFTLNGDGSITLDESLSAYAAAGTYILPCRVGRMAETVELTRRSPTVSEVNMDFVLEGMADG